MAKNKMKQVAEILGVELGEEFMIEDSKKRYKLTESGLMFFGDTGVWVNTSSSGLLIELILGHFDIKKLPWKPKEKDWYYVPDFSSPDKWEKYLYADDGVDNRLLKCCIVCKTEKQAVKLHDWIVEKVKKYRGID